MTKDEIISNLELMRAEVEWEYPIDYAATIDEAIELIKERKIGHWKIYIGMDIGDFVCSECGKDSYNTYNYCPNCGAKMKENIK